MVEDVHALTRAPGALHVGSRHDRTFPLAEARLGRLPTLPRVRGLVASPRSSRPLQRAYTPPLAVDPPGEVAEEATKTTLRIDPTANNAAGPDAAEPAPGTGSRCAGAWPGAAPGHLGGELLVGEQAGQAASAVGPSSSRAAIATSMSSGRTAAYTSSMTLRLCHPPMRWHSLSGT